MDHQHPAAAFARIPGLDGLRPIILRYDNAILISISYADTLPADVAISQMGTFDLFGDGLAQVRLPLDGATFHSEDEAEKIEASEIVDADILGYARG